MKYEIEYWDEHNNQVVIALYSAPSRSEAYDLLWKDKPTLKLYPNLIKRCTKL